MQIDILTIFPQMFASPFTQSIIKRAVTKNLVTIQIHDLRKWTNDPHHTVDDRPFGGGPGMVLMVEPIAKALDDVSCLVDSPTSRSHRILTSPRGSVFSQDKAKALVQYDQLIFIAGHYEGVDQRVSDHLVDEEISIGDYVLTGGELPVMVMVDAVVRLIPGVLGDSASVIDESHSTPGYLEYPQYTRPEDYQGHKVPKTLLSGNHAAITNWRQVHSSKRD